MCLSRRNTFIVRCTSLNFSFIFHDGVQKPGQNLPHSIFIILQKLVYNIFRKIKKFIKPCSSHSKITCMILILQRGIGLFSFYSIYCTLPFSIKISHVPTKFLIKICNLSLFGFSIFSQSIVLEYFLNSSIWKAFKYSSKPENLGS